METKETLNAIHEKIDIAVAFPELEAIDKGKHYLVVCPECGKKEAYVYKGSKVIVCNRKDKCLYKSSLFDYLQKKYSLNNQETLFRLAELAGYELEKSQVSQEKLESIAKEKKKESILKDAMEYFKSLNAKNLQYLTSRGYTKEEIEKMDLGFYPGKSVTQKYLIDKGYGMSEINEINAFSDAENSWDRMNYKLVFPYRNRYGQILTIIGRLTRPLLEAEKESDKYKNFSPFEKENFFGIEYASKEITVVEGYLDVLLAKASGIENIVACCGACVTDTQIEQAKRQGIKTITLCLDKDKAGIEGTKASIKKIMAKGLDCYVMALHNGYKDLDEFLAKGKKTSSDFLECARQSVLCSSYLAELAVKEKNLSLDRERKECFTELLQLYTSANYPVDKEAIKNVMQMAFDEAETKAFLEHVDEIEKEEKQRLKAKQAIEQKSQATKLLLEKMDSDFKANGNINIASYAEKLNAIELDYQKIAARAKQTQVEWIDTLFQKEKDAEGKELLGYSLGKAFYPVQKDLEGIQPGLYILGAQTNVGKTAFVANLAMQLLESNSDVKILYFSLDDNKDIIATRFRAMLAFSERDFTKRESYEKQNITINEFRKPLDTCKNQKREAANAKLKAFFQAERLYIYDIADTPNMTDIEMAIRQKGKESIVVIVDGLYNAGMGESQGKREENIERANKIKALVDTYSIPLICTAEVRKRPQTKGQEITIDDLMETGKFGYNANLVWLLYCEDKQEDNNEMLTLTLDYAKNKISGFKGKHEIQYFRKYAKMFVEWARPKEQKQPKGITQESFDVPGRETRKKIRG